MIENLATQIANMSSKSLQELAYRLHELSPARANELENLLAIVDQDAFRAGKPNTFLE